MQTRLKQAFNAEMNQAIKLYHNNELTSAFLHLERAHILGQTYTFLHVRSHWWMLKIAIKNRSINDVWGQSLRLLASVLLSRIWVPLGNTGGSNVSPLKPMPIPDDLKHILADRNKS